ncbi:leucine-rich repeat serine/threonine-protein kinase 1 [Neolamprologus brichardi]|uniref:leucine-rich repeat serine/threonine-protein kinase 1 n=1 Tax=Neolamprologus brichardi TaxID=32507 RepID=UPI001643D80C|nr:leucine-rich repeat serine/threonine-protein kinase 1 [Neolamprologus brichardi]
MPATPILDDRRQDSPEEYDSKPLCPSVQQGNQSVSLVVAEMQVKGAQLQDTQLSGRVLDSTPLGTSHALQGMKAYLPSPHSLPVVGACGSVGPLPEGGGPSGLWAWSLVRSGPEPTGMSLQPPLAFAPWLPGPGEDVGAKVSLVEDTGPCSTLSTQPTFQNIQAAYEDGEEDVARELIQQACCVVCSAGTPRIDGVRLLCVATQYGDLQSVCYLLKEACIPVPLEPSNSNPAVLAAHYGHTDLVKELLDSVPGPCLRKDLLNSMLAASCREGHLDVVRLLVQSYDADAKDCAIHSDEFAVITGLPLYAASQANNEEIALFLLQNGAGFSSYTLMDHPAFSRRILRLKLQETCEAEGDQVCAADPFLCFSLQQVNLCENQLSSLPPGLLHLNRIQKLSAAKNQLTALFDLPQTTNWIGLRKLEELDVSDNCLTSLPTAVMHCLKSLRLLSVSRNKLSTFPDPWACPLKQCKASSNLIENLPNTISIFWRNHLEEVDFSDNSLKELPSYIFELEGEAEANGWMDTVCPHRPLCYGYFAASRTEDSPKSRRLAFLTTWNRRDPDPVCALEFPDVLRDSLEVLCLNDNQLECVPQSVCGLHNLTELYLSNNPGIRELPTELGQLSSLWQLDIEDLNITNVPQEIRKEGAASVLAFLRAQLRKAERCKLLKMLVIGPPRQGKSVLLEALQTGKASPFTPAECSISTSIWELDKPSGGKNKKDSVIFNVWDIGGQASMSTVNQCFFTDKALYVVIWNLAMGEEAVANLQTWLLNIEARAPNSAVIVVGTHLDLIDTKFRTERLATLRAYVLALCRSPSGTRAAGYPDITYKHLHEVSCKTLEGFDGLKMLIYQVVLSMKDNSSLACGGKLLGRLIPRSYLALQEIVIAEKERRHSEGEVQYLTDAQLNDIIEQNPGSDIRDYEDLQTGIMTAFEMWKSFMKIHLFGTFSIYLLPHLLPPKPALDIHGFRQQTHNTLQRLFKMSFVPAGFWERFIARMLISLQEMDMQSFESKIKSSRSRHSRSSVIYSFTGSQQRSRCSTFRVRRSQTIYWKEGLLVTFDGGYLSVESSDVNWKRKKSGGIKIICQSETRDFSAMAFITDHVNSLIEQWFPALTGSESDGSLLVEQYAPCSLCASLGQKNQVEFPANEHSKDGDGVKCEDGPRLFLQKSQLEYSEEESDILGQGGSGTIIYRARYSNQPVAIKRFHFKKCQQQAISETDTMVKHLQSANAYRSFAEFRQESSTLHSLQHPCIVSLVGISIHPLCFALQLAPLGSLNTVLEEKHKGKSFKYMPLGHMLTFKVAYQIAAGLGYLHRKSIIFCDLKSDNILVWSLEITFFAHFNKSHCSMNDFELPVSAFVLQRPAAMHCVRQMKEPSFACLRYMLPCDVNAQLFLSQLQGYSAVFWNEDKEDRFVFYFNLLNSLMFLWQEQEVFIYSLKDMCPLSQPQKQFSCPAIITCLFPVSAREQSLDKVFAGMSDGLLAVYNVVEDLPLEGETYICSHTLNKTVFGLKDSDPRQRPYPIRTMALVGSGSQLWFSNGPGLLVIDCLSLQAVYRLETYSPPSTVISLETSFSLWGEEAVWTLDDYTNTLLLYHAASYELCAKYCCGDSSPLRSVFTVQRPTGLTPMTDLKSTHQKEKPEWSNEKVTLIFDEQAGTQMIQHQDSLTDYCSISSACSLEPVELDSSSSIDHSSFGSCSGVLQPADLEEIGRNHKRPSSSKGYGLESAETVNPAAPHLQAFTVLHVNGTLWIPRILREAALVAKDTVVCGFQKENMEWCLCVWRAWGSELEVFYQCYEKLGHLETNMRKRK